MNKELFIPEPTDNRLAVYNLNIRILYLIHGISDSFVILNIIISIDNRILIKESLA